MSKHIWRKNTAPSQMQMTNLARPPRAVLEQINMSTTGVHQKSEADRATEVGNILLVLCDLNGANEDD